MKRSKPLRRTGPLRRTPWRSGAGKTKEKSAYRRRPRDLEYMQWIRRQPCALRAVYDNCPPLDDTRRCGGRVEADHAGRRGLGQKAPDRTCIPLCHKHHVHRTGLQGAFKGWSKSVMRWWLDQMIARYQDQFANEVAR